MKILALASDYDGTLAANGRVEESTISALERFRNSGRSFILVTGRELDELLSVFSRIDLCAYVVAENGGLIYRPSSGKQILLGPHPPKELIRRLQMSGVRPLSIGRGLLATWEPHEKTVRDTLRQMGLAWRVILNKDAVMILPEGIDKATGLRMVLQIMGLSPHNVAAIGDAENDETFLSMVGYSASVANALPALKRSTDLVTPSDHGAGVVEFITRILDLDHLSGP